MALGNEHAPGATPIDPDELVGLIPDHITTQAELNEWEQSNIVQGQEWALKSRMSAFPKILTDHYVRQLHKKMFDQTWLWAGEFRTTGKNIGIEWMHIPEQTSTFLQQVDSTGRLAPVYSGLKFSSLAEK